MTTFMVGMVSTLHVPVAAQGLQAPAVVLILFPSGPLGDVHQLPAPEFLDYLRHVSGGGGDGGRAGVTAQRAVAGPLSLVVIEGDGGDALLLDILPDIELRPIQERVDAYVSAGGEVRLVVAPELRGLIGDIPLGRLVAGGEVALLGTGALPFQGALLLPPQPDGQVGYRRSTPGVLELLQDGLRPRHSRTHPPAPGLDGAQYLGVYPAGGHPHRLPLLRPGRGVPLPLSGLSPLHGPHPLHRAGRAGDNPGTPERATGGHPRAGRTGTG